jgi:hypothetical protein
MDLLNPRKWFNRGSRYFQASSLSNSIGMCWENTAILSVSLALDRAGMAFISFSSIVRTLMAHVLGIGGATIKSIGMVQGPDDCASRAYAMMRDGVGMAGGTWAVGGLVKKA